MKLVGGALRDTANHNQLVQLYWIARYDYKPNWAFREHIHDFCQIIYVMEGVGEAQLARCTGPVSQGTILFMPPGVPHALRANTERTLRTIDVKFAVVPGRFSEMLSQVREPLNDSGSRVLHVLKRTHQEAIQNAPGHYELCNALMTEVLVMILRVAKDAEPESLPDPNEQMDDELVEGARRLIHEQFRGPISVREICEAVGASQQCLSRHFKAALGMSVNEYLLRYRIDVGKEQLRYSRGSIKEVAFEVGFKSVHHFTRVFRKFEHMPPAEWRKRQSGVGREGITVTPGFVPVDVTLDERSDELIGLSHEPLNTCDDP